MTAFFPAFAAHSRPPYDSLLGSAVGPEGDQLRTLLAATAPADLTVDHINTHMAGNLWMFSPETFRYFLPAFMNLVVDHYDALNNFPAELVGALTEPTRDDVVKSLERAAEMPAGMGLDSETLQQLRQQQLEWFDSGEPLTTFRDRVAGLSADEDAAILDFLATIRDDHAEEFPFHEPEIAIERYWAQAH